MPVAGVPDSGAISVGLSLEVRTVIGGGVPEGRPDHRHRAGADPRLLRRRHGGGAGADDAHRHRGVPRARRGSNSWTPAAPPSPRPIARSASTTRSTRGWTSPSIRCRPVPTRSGSASPPTGPTSRRGGAARAGGAGFGGVPDQVKRLGLVLLLMLAPALARAQGVSMTGRATATVYGVPITFLNLQNLDFATVTRGVPKTVVQNTAAAGKVRVAGQPNAFTQIRFTLPTQLPNIQAVPGINMPISFAANSARWRRRNDAAERRHDLQPRRRREQRPVRRHCGSVLFRVSWRHRESFTHAGPGHLSGNDHPDHHLPLACWWGSWPSWSPLCCSSSSPSACTPGASDSCPCSTSCAGRARPPPSAPPRTPSPTPPSNRRRRPPRERAPPLRWRS